MGGKSKSVAAPDPIALANAQADANTKTAQEQQKLNMVSTTGPGGSVNYVADPSAPGGYRQVTTLDAANQAAYDKQNSVYNSALDTAGQQIGRVNSALSSGLDTTGLPGLQGFDDATRQRYEDAAYNDATRRLDSQYGRAQNSLDAKLAAQGLGLNSEATRNAQQTFDQSRNDAYSQARNSALQQGLTSATQAGTFNNEARNQGLQERAYVQNQPINQLSALLGLGQVQSPTGISYTPTSVANTDVLGANALSLNQQNTNANRAASTSNGLLGGLFSLGSAYLGR